MLSAIRSMKPTRPTRWLLPALLLIGLLALPYPLTAQSGGQIFNDDLTVDDGESYEGDVIVTSGDVTVKDGGVIQGNLVVWSGNTDIQEGGTVEGDVSALSGNIKLAGDVEGRVAAMSGNIELADSAVVEGDVSVLSGKIKRASGASVGGKLVQGPGFDIPKPFQGWQLPTAPVAPVVAATQTTFWGWLAGLLLRLIVGAIFIAAVVVLAAILFNVRPDVILPLQPVLRQQTAFSFVVGLVVNLVLLALIGLLVATLCLAPVALIPLLVLLALNLVGWTVVSQIVGDRLSAYLKTTIQPVASVGLGALVLTAPMALFWAFGGCFRPVAYLIWLLASACGVGAALVHWFKLGRSAEMAPAPSPLTPIEPGTPSSPTPTKDSPAEPPAADVAAPEVTTTSTLPTSAVLVVPVEPPPPAQQPQPPAPAVADDDFTVIKGIGITFDRRLKAASIHTFAQLAALTPEQIAEIIGWTAQRVLADDLVGQAQSLAKTP